MGRREDLERAREVLLMALDGERRLQGRDQSTFTEPAAGLVRELRAVVKELEPLQAAAERSKADELEAKRRARKSGGRAGAADRAPTSRRSQPRRRAGGNRTS